LGGTKICFDALVNGEIDLYPEYTGTRFAGSSSTIQKSNLTMDWQQQMKIKR